MRKKQKIVLLIWIGGSVFFFLARFGYFHGFYEEPYSPAKGVSKFYMYEFLAYNWPSIILKIWPGEGLYAMAEYSLTNQDIPGAVIPVNAMGYALIGLVLGFLFIWLQSRVGKKKQSPPNFP